MKVERISFRCTEEQLKWINTQALSRSTPAKIVKPIDVLRELIDAAMKERQSEMQKAA